MNNVNSGGNTLSIKYIPNVSSSIYNNIRDGRSADPSIRI